MDPNDQSKDWAAILIGTRAVDGGRSESFERLDGGGMSGPPKPAPTWTVGHRIPPMQPVAPPAGARCAYCGGRDREPGRFRCLSCGATWPHTDDARRGPPAPPDGEDPGRLVGRGPNVIEVTTLGSDRARYIVVDDVGGICRR